MIFVIITMMFLLSLLMFSIIFWWSLFFWTTLLFLWILKRHFYPFLIYFIVQEVRGLIFVISIGGILSYWIILLKLGVRPLHFWVFSVIGPLKRYSLIWFNTFQKIPYFFPLRVLFLKRSRIFILFGRVVLVTQIFMVKGLEILFTLGSIESFNSVLLCLEEDALNVIFVVLIYWSLMGVLIISNNLNKVIKKEEMKFWQIKFPLALPFFLKMIILGGVLISGWGFLVFFFRILGILIIFWKFLIVRVPLRRKNNLKSLFVTITVKTFISFIFF
jgi:hypothetical protein